jgi:hypothetical protein
MNFKEIDEKFLSNYDEAGNFQSNKILGDMIGAAMFIGIGTGIVILIDFLFGVRLL